MKRLGWLKIYMPAYLKGAVPAWIALLMEVLVDLSLPTLMASIVNVGIHNKDTGFIFKTGAIMITLAFFGASVGLVRNHVSTKVSQELGTRLRADLFRKTQRLSMAAINQFGAAPMITRLTNDVMQIQNMSFMLTRVFIRAPLLLIGSIVMAFILNRSLATILVIVLPILAFLIWLRIKRGLPFFDKVQGALDGLNQIMREYLSGIRVVKVFNRFDYEQEKFDAANENLTGISVRAARSMASIQPLMMILMNGSIILVLWLSGLRISQNHMQVGDVIAFVNYFLQILQAMMMVSWIFTAGVRASTSAYRIGELFALEEGMVRPAEPVSPLKTGTVEMKDVSFGWPGQSQPFLKNISFRLEKGRTMAIIGSTGAGKTTLVNLIPRFHDVNEGSVMVDGTDVREYDLKDLRQRVSMVPQQSVLFTGSIGDNLLWGNPDASQDELNQAIRIAHAHEFIDRFPEGLDTWIGQGGVNLSGGQKQRLCIARALLKNAPILIFDDSTSALDRLTEAGIRQSLKSMEQPPTVITIAQRIYTVMDADNILVIDEGRIVGEGKHAELLQNCQVYQDIYRSQVGLDPSGREVV